FYLGFFALGRLRNPGGFLLGLVVGFAVVLAVGFQQHFGGLAGARRYFLFYIYPQMEEGSFEYLEEIHSNRVWATLFYPNTLAGVILMLLPMSLAVIWSLRERFTVGARSFLMAAMGVAAMSCLYWSGSKGGWLLMLVIGLVGTLFLPFKRQLKVILVVA